MFIHNEYYTKIKVTGKKISHKILIFVNKTKANYSDVFV